MKHLVLLLTATLLSSCLGNVERHSTCNTEDELVESLTENYAVWAVQEIPFGSTAVTTLEINRRACAVQACNKQEIINLSYQSQPTKVILEHG